MIRWVMIINTTGMKWLKQLFHINEHRINNTGWMMKRRGGTNSRIVVERMLNVFDLHFSTPAVEAMSRIYACKTERNLQIFGWCLQFKQSCLWATRSYFCLQNKAGKSTQWGQSSQKMHQKSSTLSIRFECERSLFANWIHYIATKKPQPLRENWNEKGIVEKGIAANNAQYNTQGRGGGGVEWEDSGGGGGRLLYTNLYMSRVK